MVLLLLLLHEVSTGRIGLISLRLIEPSRITCFSLRLPDRSVSSRGNPRFPLDVQLDVWGLSVPVWWRLALIDVFHLMSAFHATAWRNPAEAMGAFGLMLGVLQYVGLYVQLNAGLPGGKQLDNQVSGNRKLFSVWVWEVITSPSGRISVNTVFDLIKVFFCLSYRTWSFYMKPAFSLNTNGWRNNKTEERN